MSEERTISIKFVAGETPVITFNGAWITKDVQTVMRVLPKVYRQYQYNQRKQGVGKFEEAANHAE